MTSYFSAEQVNQLLKPINGKRVLARDGMSYVAAHDVKAHLNRVFGFGRWSSEVVEQSLVFEVEKIMGNGKPGWYVCYRSVVRLTVCAPDGTQCAVYTEGHVGDNTGPTRGDVHGNAVANSESYALKRCAAMLGDQFGLSLYEKGSTRPLVGDTLVHPAKAAVKPDVDGSEVTSMGNDERDTDPAPEPADVAPLKAALAPVVEVPAPAQSPPQSSDEVVAALRVRVLDALKVEGKTAATQEIVRIQIAASKAKVQQARTQCVKGDAECTVSDLIAEAQQMVSRRDSLPRGRGVA
jgi:hypothetical protein